MIPGVNQHILVPDTKYCKSPGCCTIGCSLGIKPIHDHFIIYEVHVTTFQSLSGRGDALYSNDVVVGNIYPIGKTQENQENYIRDEIKKLFELPDLLISVSAQRVYVQRNHSLVIFYSLLLGSY